MTIIRLMMPFLALPLIFFPNNYRIDGEYVDSSGRKIIVSGSKLTYIDHPMPYVYDTLAICHLDHVQNQLYSIKSDVITSLLSSGKTELMNGECDADSVTVILRFPFSRSVLSVYVSIIDQGWSSERIKKTFLYPEENKCTLPAAKDDSIIDISIGPLHPVDYRPFDIRWANYLGILYFWDSIKISKKTKTVVYSNPGIDDRIFHRLNIQGEYLIIKKKKIIWRDTVFQKKELR